MTATMALPNFGDFTIVGIEYVSATDSVDSIVEYALAVFPDITTLYLHRSVAC